MVMYALLNIAGINSQVICIFNNQKENSVHRKYVKELAVGLTDDHLKRRAALTNLPREVRERGQEVAGTSFQHVKADQFPEGTRKRCFFCKKDSKTKYFCKICKKFICLSHAQFSCSECSA